MGAWKTRRWKGRSFWTRVRGFGVQLPPSLIGADADAAPVQPVESGWGVLLSVNSAHFPNIKLDVASVWLGRSKGALAMKRPVCRANWCGAQTSRTDTA